MECEVRIVKNAQDMLDALEIRREVFVEEQKVPPKRERDGEDHKCSHIICRFNGEAVGTLRFHYLDKNTVKIERIAIRKRYRGKGFGRDILIFLEGFAKKRGVSELVLYGQARAGDFYKKLGYSTDGKITFDARIKHFKFVKKL
ncbi:GNAT family N-acetyltransferase [Candidatus Micrarchaeota archaeon]|nr:GNAT family N-acetyltransferase [Candidatus Micrarchaeota archaeon]